MFRIGKTFKFDAAHQLHGLPLGHKCGRLHGHTYSVTFELRSYNTHPITGFVLDYGEMAPLKDYIDGTLDHRNLNDILDFQPTAELLAAHFFDIANVMLDLPDGVYVDRVVVKETENTFAEFCQPDMRHI